MEKLTNDSIEIRTELINKAENHKKAPVNETIASDNNPLSRDTFKETNEQNENRVSGTATVNKPMAGKAKQNRRRKARKGKSQPDNERRAENKGESDESEKKSQCERTEEAQNTEKRGGQQKEIASQRVKIIIIGDSQLKRLDETKLSNHHHQVKIVAKGGSRIRQATQQVGKSDSDIIVVHAGTNYIKSSNAEALSDDIINTLNKIQESNNPSNPTSQIAYSSMFRRNDKNDPTPNRKVAEVNKILEEKLNLHGFDFINNANILFCNLWKDGLHINDGGIRKFAGNLSSYFRYC